MTLRAITRGLPTTFFRARALSAAPAAHASHHLNSPAPPPPPPPWAPDYGGASAALATGVLHEHVRLRDTREVPDARDDESKAPDERTLRLGKTISELHERLPTLLATPLPPELLSAQIALHLFPTTLPHLPTVRGRMAYTAALWTAPVAWGRVPVLGNVRLHILSARVVNLGPCGQAARRAGPAEKLIVRWKTCGSGDAESDSGVLRVLSRSRAQLAENHSANDEFTGLFIFEFDAAGRIARHTIEHAQRGGNWDRMTRVVSVTDWLLGLAKRRREQGLGEEPGLALGCAAATAAAAEDSGGGRAHAVAATAAAAAEAAPTMVDSAVRSASSDGGGGGRGTTAEKG